jgi:hypothetical protein
VARVGRRCLVEVFKKSVNTKFSKVLNSVWWRCRDLNPGHCGYEPTKANSSDSDLDKESKDNQELKKRK